MVSWGRGHPSRLSLWRREFESRWDRKKFLCSFKIEWWRWVLQAPPIK